MLFPLQQVKLMLSFTCPILRTVPQSTAVEWVAGQRHFSQLVAVRTLHRPNPATLSRITPRRPLHASALSGTNDQPKNNIEQSSALISPLQLCIPTVEDMQELGALVASTIFSDNATALRRRCPARGSVVCLHGDIGAGKTVLAAGFVTFATGMTRVTSPTYLLSNTYRVNVGNHAESDDDDDLEIHHLDLYRLSGPTDLAPLNLPHVFSNCIALIEWPSRLEHLMPSDRLDIYIQLQLLDNNKQRQSTGDMGDDDDSTETMDNSNISRLVTLKAHGSQWTERLRSLVDEGYVDDWVVDGSTEEP